AWNATALAVWTRTAATWAWSLAAWLSRAPETASTMIMLTTAITPASESVNRRPARELLFIWVPPQGTAAGFGGRGVEQATPRTEGRAARWRPPRPRPRLALQGLAQEVGCRWSGWRCRRRSCRRAPTRQPKRRFASWGGRPRRRRSRATPALRG